MGLETLQGYRDALGTITPGALQRSNIGIGLVDKWVNQAIREFGYALKFHELEATAVFSTIVGATTYSFPSMGVSNIRYLDEMWVTDFVNGVTSRVRPETRTKYKKNLGAFLDSNTFGLPIRYHRFTNNVFLRPTPDAIYTISLDYYKAFTPLVDPDDVSPFSEDWDEVVLVGALYRGFRHFGEFDRYQNVRNDFLGLVRSRKSDFELEEFPEGGISPLGPQDTEEVEENT